MRWLAYSRPAAARRSDDRKGVEVNGVSINMNTEAFRLGRSP